MRKGTAASELEALARLTSELTQSTDLDQVLGPVLRTITDGLGLERVALSLVEPDRQELVIEAAHGLTPAEVRRGRFSLGEGVIGKVVATASPALVPRIQAEPRFLNRTGAFDAGTDLAYVCVPVQRAGRVLGVLSGYRPANQANRLERDVRWLTIVATLLLPAVEQRRARPVQLEATAPRNMIGRSKAIQQVYSLIDQVSDSATTVLLRGESGTGKELIASALHENSPRRRGAFVKVNCAALPETVIESELFGHERGAFTGALHQRKGRFELADNGTIFLDEIGDLSAATQVKLLRVLQQREFERVGGNQTLQVDVRVITATSRPLEAMMEDGTFREDLYYRLNVFPIHLPALRERQSDVLLLADHFIEVFNRAHGKAVRRLSTPAIDMLMAYHWPGNVRELENCIERGVLLARDSVLHGHHLPPSLQTADATGTRPTEGLKERLDAVERELIMDALKSTRGNMAQAARDLRVSERIMGLRVAKYAIDLARFKSSPTSP